MRTEEQVLGHRVLEEIVGRRTAACRLPEEGAGPGETMRGRNGDHPLDGAAWSHPGEGMGHGPDGRRLWTGSTERSTRDEAAEGWKGHAARGQVGPRGQGTSGRTPVGVSGMALCCGNVAKLIHHF